MTLYEASQSIERENRVLRRTIKRLTEQGEGEECTWDEAERNTIDEIVCRVHPDGADAIEKFWAWYEPQAGKWLGPHRACGAWLHQQLRARSHADSP